jgi:hypothetical protein
MKLKDIRPEILRWIKNNIVIVKKGTVSVAQTVTWNEDKRDEEFTIIGKELIKGIPMGKLKTVYYLDKLSGKEFKSVDEILAHGQRIMDGDDD